MIALTRTRLILASIATVFAVGASVYAFHVLEEYLIRDARFVVAPGDAEQSSGLTVSGVVHASPRAVEAVFGDDFGRSLYSVPLAERRESLRSVAWVRDASVARVWPNRLVVNVTERTPVAFVAIRRAEYGLIDQEGVILPPAKDRFQLPVLAGVKASDDDAQRRQAVERMMRVTAELGEAVADIAEIDVSNPDNIVLKREYEGRERQLLLGNERFAQRYQNFLKHFGDIESKVPNATKIDLRLEDRITVVEAGE